MRVLLIEDEREMAAWLERALTQSGFLPEHAPDAARAEALLAESDYAAVVMDLHLPDKHGLVLLRGMRNRGDMTPVLILTAQGSLQDRVRGLNLGADDFLTKPFALEELEARLAALEKARARAETYAKALGLRVRRIVSIGEGSGGGFRPMVVQMAAKAFDRAESTPVAPGESTLSVSLDVVFELGR